MKSIGPKKINLLIENGYPLDRISSSDFYDILKIPGFGVKTAYQLFEQLGLEIAYPPMEESHSSIEDQVVIDNKVIKPWREHRTKRSNDIATGPEEFDVERTTTWSFPERGSWASHTGQYRGNWPPQLVRNIIELYSEEGDTVLDPMAGGGTTPVECLLTNRNSISVDINPDSIAIVRDRLDLPDEIAAGLKETSHRTFVGDVRNLDLIGDDSIDLIATHPPYVNIIHYAPLVEGDLSQFSDYDLFFKEFSIAISEMHRVLKPGKKCAILIGDTHKKSHFVPISARMMIEFLKAGFVLKEDIIKQEWNCDSSRSLAKYGKADFLLTMHEHLFIFEKPGKDSKYSKESTIGFFS